MKPKCDHRSTYINGLGSEICIYCGQTVNQPDTITSNSTETPKRMKPLDKLEQKFYKILTGMDYSSAYDQYKEEAFPPITDSRECAQVAKDLAERSMMHVMEDAYKRRDFTNFLTSEGITE